MQQNKRKSSAALPPPASMAAQNSRPWPFQENIFDTISSRRNESHGRQNYRPEVNSTTNTNNVWPDRDYVCGIGNCNQRFGNKYAMNHHLLRSHGHVDVDVNDLASFNDVASMTRQEPPQCQGRGELTKDFGKPPGKKPRPNSAFAEEQQNQKNASKQAKRTKPTRINRTGAGPQTLASPANLSRVSQSRSQCLICEANMSGPRNLEAHIKRYHRMDRSFTCDICGKGFASAWMLPDHRAECQHSKEATLRAEPIAEAGKTAKLLAAVSAMEKAGNQEDASMNGLPSSEIDRSHVQANEMSTQNPSATMSQSSSGQQSSLPSLSHPERVNAIRSPTATLATAEMSTQQTDQATVTDCSNSANSSISSVSTIPAKASLTTIPREPGTSVLVDTQTPVLAFGEDSDAQARRIGVGNAIPKQEPFAIPGQGQGQGEGVTAETGLRARSRGENLGRDRDPEEAINGIRIRNNNYYKRGSVCPFCPFRGLCKLNMSRHLRTNHLNCVPIKVEVLDE